MKKSYIPQIKALRSLLEGELPECLSSASFPAAVGFFTEPAGRLFINGLLVLTAITLIREVNLQNRPVRILGVTRTGDGRVRVDLENRGSRKYFASPSVREPYYPTKDEKERLSGIPMLPASSTDQKVAYDLLGEADEAVVIAPGEIKQVFIKCPETEDILKGHVSVTVRYGTTEGELKDYVSRDAKVREPSKHPYLRDVGESRAFILKKDHDEIIEEASMLDGLLSAVESAPPEAIVFHMRDGNDFARWVKDVVGDEKLAQALSDIKLDDPEQTQARIVQTLRGRIMDVEKEEFSGRHPNLAHVGEAYTFKLREDHDRIVGEAAFLEELRDAILKSPTDVVIYHMQDGKNDFADWAKNVLGDQELGNTLSAVELISPRKTQEVLAQVIDARIKELEG